MFKISKQISNASKTIKQATSSIGGMFQRPVQEYKKDISHELTFLNVLPQQSLIKDKLDSFHFETQDIAKPQSIDKSVTKKLIYQRFADKINAKNQQNIKSIIQLEASEQKKEFSATNENINWAEIRKAIYNRFADEIHSWNKKQQGDIIKYSSDRSVNEELELIKEQGYSFAKQKAALKRSITDKWDEIERIKYLSQETLWNAKNQQKQLSHV